MAISSGGTGPANLNGNAESLLITIGQAFPLHGDIAKRFGLESKFFQVAAPQNLRSEVSESIEQMEISDQRRRVAEEAQRQLQCDLDGFLRECASSRSGRKPPGLRPTC